MLVTISSALLPSWTHRQHHHHLQFPTPDNERRNSDNAPDGLSSSLSTLTADDTTSDTHSINRLTSEEEAPQIRMVPCIDLTREAGMRIDVIERDLRPGTVLELGRFTDEFFIPNRISFRNKVISRRHAVIWTVGHKFYIRDTRSSSGTFLNNVRLCAANKESKTFPLKDGDILQLGVDFRGGAQDIYRSIKFRLEINRKRIHQVDVFGFQAYQSLRKLTSTPTTTEKDEEESMEQDQDACSEPDCAVKDCCICLYAVAPFQALFVAPCQHTFHYKCIRPLLSHYPGFQCPLCRSYADLERSVAVETGEVREILKKIKSNDTCLNEVNSSSSRICT
ncbi:hypothetical protein BDB00DRAFT_870474 [Zychaea mexicana]|uniref:uncharacterized protein n=1 Tax=Zychaea mexicana TaxID=64656 RepID=UPI0022FEA55A|nr:uncharacterized protein BDB00DRAFT_870474 [Zychaea mexicana]KAI9495324.1 hypothetical protein BDB00DRAFT_870474 [Zychaea mexicana]